MKQQMKLSEVAAYLGRSIDMVRRYRNDGLLNANKVGKELFFDREEVVMFAQSRGIRTIEGEVPQGANFTETHQLAQEIAEMVVSMLGKKVPELITGKV